MKKTEKTMARPGKIVILSPPFYSHFHPLKTLGKSLKAIGIQVGIACSEGFRKEIEAGGLEFYPLTINKNRNTGIAKKTDQDQEEQRRLEEFFQSTYRGPVSTLITQSEHRMKDMFANPRELIDAIEQLYHLHKPDCMIVDQLSYGATLALIGLDIPFLTFCPPHPKTIGSWEEGSGLTEHWPEILEPRENEKAMLKKKQQELNRIFSSAYEEVFKDRFPHRDIPEELLNSPFSMTSPRGILYMYPDFAGEEPDIPSFFLHHCFDEETLDSSFRKRVSEGNKRKVMISFGTFLSERKDVIEKIIRGFLSHDQPWEIYAASGGHDDFYRQFSSEDVITAPFLPQKALISHMDLVIHHGGVNSFTETLYYGKPMMIVPFSSDQFAVAHDGEKYHLAAVLDPNGSTKEQLHQAIEKVQSETVQCSLQHWKKKSRQNGPLKGAQWIKEHIIPRIMEEELE